MRVIFLLLTIIAMACQNAPAEQLTVQEIKKTVADTVLVPEKLQETDSIQLVYYPEPGNQKYNRDLAITDTAFIRELTSNFRTGASTDAACQMDTRLFCFDKDGNLIKTVYAATKGDCNFIAFTGNGGVNYYYPISEATLAFIRQSQKSFKLD